MSVVTEKSARKRGTMGASTVLVQNTPVGTTRMSLGGPGMTIRRSTNVVSSRSMGPGIVRAHGEAGRLSKDTLGNIAGSRGKEKKEMTELNNKLAGFLEKTKFLEATCNQLNDELERLRKSKGYTQERVRDEYREELEEARDALAGIKKELAELQSKNLTLVDKVDTKDNELDALKRRINDLLAELQRNATVIGQMEGELASLRNTIDNSEREKNMMREDIQRLQADNDRIRNDCEAARAKQIEAEGERAAAHEELHFEKDIYEAEIMELRALLEELRNVTPKIQDKWKSDFKNLIEVLQAEYNRKLEIMEDDTRRRYEDQLISIQNAQQRDQTDNITKTENKTLKSSLSENKTKIMDLERENARLRADLDDLRRRFDEECEDCENEKAKLRAENADLQDDIQEVIASLQEMKSDNLNLTLEIACYRKLLEGEESKMARSIEQQGNMQSSGGAALAGIISSGGAQSSQSSNMSESTGTVRMSRTSRGHMTIKEIDNLGRWISISNSSKDKTVDLSGYKLERSYGRGRSASFVFPQGTSVRPGQEIRIVSYNNEDEKGPNDILADRNNCKTWGTGNGKVDLINPSGDSKADCLLTFQ